MRKTNLANCETPGYCEHNNASQVAPMRGCKRCKGSGWVEYESDEYPPGFIGCCCICKTCRSQMAVANQILSASNDLASQGKPQRAGVVFALEIHKLFVANDLGTIRQLLRVVDTDTLSESQLLALLDATRHGGADLLCYSDAGKIQLGKHREVFAEKAMLRLAKEYPNDIEQIRKQLC